MRGLKQRLFHTFMVRLEPVLRLLDIDACFMQATPHVKRSALEWLN